MLVIPVFLPGSLDLTLDSESCRANCLPDSSAVPHTEPLSVLCTFSIVLHTHVLLGGDTRRPLISAVTRKRETKGNFVRACGVAAGDPFFTSQHS